MEPLEMPMAGRPHWIGIKVWKTVRKSFLITIIYVKTTVTSALCLFKVLLLISLHKAAEESWGEKKKKGYLL